MKIKRIRRVFVLNPIRPGKRTSKSPYVTGNLKCRFEDSSRVVAEDRSGAARNRVALRTLPLAPEDVQDRNVRDDDSNDAASTDGRYRKLR